jgi:hypothetical protein
VWSLREVDENAIENFVPLPTVSADLFVVCRRRTRSTVTSKYVEEKQVSKRSLYKTMKCSCCKRRRGDVVEHDTSSGGRTCRPCEKHAFTKRSGVGSNILLVLPKACPGPGVVMTAEAVRALFDGTSRT